MKYITTFDLVFFVLISLQAASMAFSWVLNRLAEEQSPEWRAKVHVRTTRWITLLWILLMAVTGSFSFAGLTTFLFVCAILGTLYAAVMWGKFKRQWNEDFNRRMADEMAKSMVENAHG